MTSFDPDDTWRRVTQAVQSAIVVAPDRNRPGSELLELKESDAERPTAWLGREDSNSEMSTQIISLKGRTDFPGSYQIVAAETVRV